MEATGSCSGRLNLAGANPTYDEAVAVSGKIEIGGEETATEVFEPGLARGGSGSGSEGAGNRGGSTVPNWSPLVPRSLRVRFASTHFADDATIPVKATIVWKLFKNLAHVATTTTSATVNVKAYNKLQTLGTNVDEYGTYRASIALASSKTASAAVTALDPSHTSAPGSWPFYETHSTITTRLQASTVMSALTHGSTNEFADSDKSEIVTFGYDVNAAVTGRAGTIPRFNLVAFWSCQTLIPGAENSSPAPNKFGVIGDLDRAYAGFNASVFDRMWSKAIRQANTMSMNNLDSDLGDHAYIFWTEILSGKTVHEAVQKANEEYPPIGVLQSGNPPQYGDVPMLYVGDPRTNLINVYLTLGEYNALLAANKPTNVWWIKL